ncbi:MAG TPA: chemotaxis protein CheW [Candidatus Xenobia bacterium]
MLLLTFRLGAERYGLDVAPVVRVLPQVETRPVPGAPPWVRGLANLEGASLPVLDLCMLALGRPARDAMSTRLIQLRIGEVMVGLLAESVNEVVRVDPSAFGSSGLDLPQTRYLGPVMAWEDGFLQKVEPAELLPPEVLELLKT